MQTATMEAPVAAPVAAPVTMPGAWTRFEFTLTDRAKEVFKKALHGLVGVKYTPFAFATQVVAGTNWCFLAEAKVPLSKYEDAVLLYINQPLHGDPHIIEINKIRPSF